MLKYLVFGLVIIVVFVCGSVATNFDLVNACTGKGSFKTLTGVTVKCEVIK